MVTPVIDSKALAMAVVEGVRAAMPQTQEAPKQQVSQFQQVYEQFASDPNNDPGTLAALKAMLEAKEADIQSGMSAKQQKDMNDAIIRNRDNTAYNTIKATIADLRDKGVIELEDGDEEIFVNRVVTKFNKDEAYAGARAQAANGMVDTAALQAITKEVINKEAEKRTPSGKSAGFTGGAKQNVTQPAQTSEGGDVDHQVSRLSGKQLSMYNSHLSLLSNSAGMKKDDKATKEKALKAALRVGK